jgi:DNA-binding NtrC family response regulator
VYDDSNEWPADTAVSSAVMDEAYHGAKDRVVAQFEKEYLTRLVARAGGNMSKAARLASIDRTTLYRLMDKHAFHRDEAPGSAE